MQQMTTTLTILTITINFVNFNGMQIMHVAIMYTCIYVHVHVHAPAIYPVCVVKQLFTLMAKILDGKS